MSDSQNVFGSLPSDSRETKLKSQIERLTIRYGTEEITSDVYEVTMKVLTSQLSAVEAELAEAENNSSNFSNVVESTVAIACHLKTLWSAGDFETRQEIQKMAFPEGIVWNRKNDNYLTPKENLALVAFRSISDSCKNSNTKKEDKSFDLSSVVDQTLRISNLEFIEGLLRVQAFIDRLDR